MRITIRYFRPMVYGNFTTVGFEDINPDQMQII